MRLILELNIGRCPRFDFKSPFDGESRPVGIPRPENGPVIPGHQHQRLLPHVVIFKIVDQLKLTIFFKEQAPESFHRFLNYGYARNRDFYCSGMALDDVYIISV